MIKRVPDLSRHLVGVHPSWLHENKTSFILGVIVIAATAIATQEAKCEPSHVVVRYLNARTRAHSPPVEES